MTSSNGNQTVTLVVTPIVNLKSCSMTLTDHTEVMLRYNINFALTHLKKAETQKPKEQHWMVVISIFIVKMH